MCREPLFGAVGSSDTGWEPEKKRRNPMWEIPGGLQCSIIGTCFSHNEILKIAHRLKLEIEPGTSDYDVHAHFVRESSSDCLLARMLQKELDRKYAGLIRRVGRMTCPEELAALWVAAFSSGRISGAYWALLSHTHVEPELQKRAFGEVHMLSHVLGRATHSAAQMAGEQLSRINVLEEKVRTQAQRHQSAIAERDGEISKLTQRLQHAVIGRKASACRPQAPVGHDRMGRLLLRRERALISARERARSSEMENNRLRGELQRLTSVVQGLGRLKPEAAQCPGAAACDLDLPQLRVLYLGGRPSAIDRLKSIAEESNALMVHHDGGLEQSMEQIDGLVPGCDAVFCPVDCISHGACERAKSLCRKLAKPFIPLRSSGATTFKRALLDLHC